jgi:phenylalanyl-tRNA synthetase beta chain
MSVLRPSLLSSMLAVAANNIRFGNTDLSLYEVGHVFRAGDGLVPETTHLGILLSGNIAPLRWDQGARAVDFFDLKGVVETFLERFGVGGALFDTSGPGYFGDEASSVAINGVSTMEFGKVSIEFLKHFDIAQEVYFCEVNLEAFEASTQGELTFERLPRFGAVSRDMALLLDASYSAADVAQFVRSQAGPLCSGIDVFDSFAGDPLPPGKRNLGLRLYFMPRDRNLSKEELDGIMAKAAQRVAAQFNVTVRGREGDGS